MLVVDRQTIAERALANYSQTLEANIHDTTVQLQLAWVSVKTALSALSPIGFIAPMVCISLALTLAVLFPSG